MLISVNEQNDYSEELEKFDKTFIDKRGFEICIFSNKLCFDTKTQAKKHRHEYEIGRAHV